MSKTVTSITGLAAASALVVAVAGCDATKSSTPLSPNVAGPIAGVNLTVPAPVSPTNGAEVTNSEPVRLVFQNAATNGERPFWYVVELAALPRMLGQPVRAVRTIMGQEASARDQSSDLYREQEEYNVWRTIREWRPGVGLGSPACGGPGARP